MRRVNKPTTRPRRCGSDGRPIHQGLGLFFDIGISQTEIHPLSHPVQSGIRNPFLKKNLEKFFWGGAEILIKALKVMKKGYTDIDWYWSILTVLIYSIYSLPSITGLMHGIKDLQNPDGAPVLHHPPGSLGESWPNGSTTCGMSCLEHLVIEKECFILLASFLQVSNDEPCWILSWLVRHYVSTVATCPGTSFFATQCHLNKQNQQMLLFLIPSEGTIASLILCALNPWKGKVLQLHRATSAPSTNWRFFRSKKVTSSEFSVQVAVPRRVSQRSWWTVNLFVVEMTLWQLAISNYLKVHAGFLMSNLLE